MSKVLDNLIAAFNGESNAHAKYLAYAKKADEEGYTKVACLFRATARAEQIHFTNHAKVIKIMVGEAKADIQLPEIRSTRENLLDAISGEMYERYVMYMDFLKDAETVKDNAAIRTFQYALDAEECHYKLYNQALHELEKMKGDPIEFYVCPVCGFTVSKATFLKCPVCNAPGEKFEKVI